VCVHLQDEDYEIELNYLKEKCDAGGDIIITQLFYDFDHFKVCPRMYVYRYIYAYINTV